jgi:hypothetical protein
MMKPPMVDASNRPVKRVIVKSVTASPLVRLLKISEKTAATTVIGHAPNNPPKNRHNMMVYGLSLLQRRIGNNTKRHMAIKTRRRRPRSSESGVQKIGPVANPSTCKDKPSVPTSVEYMTLVNVALNVVNASITAVRTLDKLCQYLWFVGGKQP